MHWGDSRHNKNDMASRAESQTHILYFSFRLLPAISQPLIFQPQTRLGQQFRCSEMPLCLCFLFLISNMIFTPHLLLAGSMISLVIYRLFKHWWELRVRLFRTSGLSPEFILASIQIKRFASVPDCMGRLTKSSQLPKAASRPINGAPNGPWDSICC